MKTKIILLLAILSTCINYGQRKVSKKSQYLTKIINEQSDYGLPKGTKVDVLKKFDKKTNTEIEIVIPISGNAKFDNQLHQIIEAEKENFIETSDVVEMSNYFEVKPLSIYISKKIISFAFAIATENGGAAHGGLVYYSYNYDVEKNKEIKFEDYFKIQSEEDEDFINGLINESIKLQDNENLESGKWEELEVDFKTVDFNIEKDSITFNLGCIRSYAQGFFRAEVNKLKLETFIYNNYR